MEFIKIDDSRLDESFPLLFSFKKGDIVRWRDEPSRKGKITDGVFVGDLPAHVSDAVYRRGRTLYQITLAENEQTIAVENEIDKAE